MIITCCIIHNMIITFYNKGEVMDDYLQNEYTDLLCLPDDPEDMPSQMEETNNIAEARRLRNALVQNHQI